MILHVTLAGLLSGFVMGMIGIGGGAFLVPLLLFSGLTLQQATAIVLLTQVVPQTLPALLLYYKNNTLPIKEGILVILGSLIGTTIGAYVSTSGYMSQKLLYRCAAISLIVLGILIWWKYC